MLLVLGLLALVIGLAGGLEGVSGLRDGLSNTIRLIRTAAPQMLIGFLLAGMITAAIPPSAIGRWMGDEAGKRGLLVGLVVGALSPGGPYIVYPIAAALLSSGAGIGPMTGFLAARNLVTVNRLLIWEIPFLGAPFALARVVTSLWLPAISVLFIPPLYRLIAGSKRPGTLEPNDERDAE